MQQGRKSSNEMGLDVTADAAEEAKFGDDDIPYISVGSKTGWTEKGETAHPKIWGGAGPFFFR